MNTKMSKRKKSIPVKMRPFFTRPEVLKDDVSDFHINDKKASLCIPEISNNLEGHDNLVKGKRKKIYKILPVNCVILGDISFLYKKNEKIFFNLDDVDLNVFVNETTEFVEIALKICLSSDKNIFTFLDLMVTNELLLKSLNDLMQHHYLWVINEEEFRKNEIIKMSIATTLDKTPIFKAENIVELFFGKIDKVDNSFALKKCCTKEFFKEMQECQKNKLTSNDNNVQHEKLLPNLCPYQVRAVVWMLNRENKELQSQNINWLSDVVVTLKSKCNKNIYYNKYSRILFLEFCNFPPLPKGGILADEMGLGKTVAVISLILNHPRSIRDEIDNKDFFLPNTRVEETALLLKSTQLACNNEIIASNKEDSLDANEKLVYSRVSRGPALKKALNEWYESKLAEFSAATPNKLRRYNNDNIKCICGNVKKNGDCIKCPACDRFQHIICSGYKEKLNYFCPSCWTKQKLVKSCATLIIAPPSIYHQWFDEIKKHVAPDGFLNGVFMYNGLKDEFIQPSVLAEYDIVITTYAVLRTEINYAVPNESNRKLRNEKRFLKMCSPLTQIQWWRLCLDEAQMVENDCSQLNQMANLISSVNRWSVTGTPIQKSITDLYYLIEWLGVEPFNEKTIWNNLLYLPYINGFKFPLCSTMSSIFWRNSKEDVAEELIIPKQIINYHFLKFTAIEQNFYMREHCLSSADFSDGLRRLRLDTNRTIDSIDKFTLSKVLAPLLNLRQACSHPLAVKGSKISSKTGSMTLSELLKYLFNKTKLECEESVRKYIAALNGLAGINCIQEDWCNAVEQYRQVLQLTEEYKEKIQIDSLQRIHTLTNLAEILQCHPEGIPPTLRDDSLKNETEMLEVKYMQKSINELKSDENILKEMSTKVSELMDKFETASDIWWYRLIHLLTIEGSVTELMDKIAAELSTSEVENRKNVELFLSKISSIKGIEIMLKNWLNSIEENRKKALKHIGILKKSPCEDLVNLAVDCHLRTLGAEIKRKKCQLCICESVLLDYECSLFDVSRKVLKEQYEKVLDGAQTKGSWRPQNAEKCLKVLLNVCKSKAFSESWCLRDGRTHIQLLEAMKKEFKQIRAVWMSINHQVQAKDELSMCKMRLRLRLPGEPIPPKITKLSLTEQNKFETIYIIEHHEIESQRSKLIGEIEISKSEFRKKYGTLLYLANLGQKENPNPEPCPVCKTILENEWCVLQCGHSYCIDCIRILLTRSPKPSISCPVCREITKSSDLGFIDLSGEQENSDINVIGDHSTKVDAIVRKLLELKREDSKVKVLVFSTWAVVLRILEVALNQNGISFRRMPGHNYQLHLKQFRDSCLNITALLLPISWGSKGLNLTEASHVFLVEPIMNPAEELQAIGRVHRIGQTKETFVHRFLIRGTIEEKIHAAVSEAKDKWGQKKVTLEDLKNLFDMKNEFVTSTSRAE